MGGGDDPNWFTCRSELNLMTPVRAANLGDKWLISIVKFIQGLFARDLARCHMLV